MTHSTNQVKAQSLLDLTREQIKKAEKLNEAREALIRLRKNKDFKLIFDDLYFREHLDDLTQSLAVLSSADAITGANRAIAGVGSLRYYLNCLEYNGMDVQSKIEELRQHEALILAGKIDESGNFIEDENSEITNTEVQG